MKNKILILSTILFLSLFQLGLGKSTFFDDFEKNWDEFIEDSKKAFEQSSRFFKQSFKKLKKSEAKFEDFFDNFSTIWNQSTNISVENNILIIKKTFPDEFSTENITVTINDLGILTIKVKKQNKKNFEKKGKKKFYIKRSSKESLSIEKINLKRYDVDIRKAQEVKPQFKNGILILRFPLKRTLNKINKEKVLEFEKEESQKEEENRQPNLNQKPKPKYKEEDRLK